MYFGHQRFPDERPLRLAARLTGRLPTAATDECRFVQWTQSERETDEKERFFVGTRFLTIDAGATAGNDKQQGPTWRLATCAHTWLLWASATKHRGDASAVDTQFQRGALWLATPDGRG